MRVERMRHAILQDLPLDLIFASSPLTLGNPGPMTSFIHGGMSARPAGTGPQAQGMYFKFVAFVSKLWQSKFDVFWYMSLGHGAGQVDSRGGQLQIAGVVVGNWGPNIQAQHQKQRGRGRGDPPPPQVTSVGPRRCKLIQINSWSDFKA